MSHADGIVVLCTSSSLFREDRKHAQLIARANRYLHYREMCWGKQQGYRVYDMGGYHVREDFWMDVDMDDNEYIKVSNFKDSLGGDIKYFKAGYIFQCSAYRNIVFNLEKNKELLGRKKIILYGYAQWGRFVEKYLREHFGLVPYVRIDNKLFKRNKSLYNSEVLQRLIADDAIVLLTLDEKNCRIVMQESNIQPYKQVRHIVCVKLK
ncbi:hypothetical protein [Pectinatus frisingensis]|nr:hypothetical protein [Pectinatus frisingensis]